MRNPRIIKAALKTKYVIQNQKQRTVEISKAIPGVEQIRGLIGKRNRDMLAYFQTIL